MEGLLPGVCNGQRKQAQGLSLQGVRESPFSGEKNCKSPTTWGSRADTSAMESGDALVSVPSLTCDSPWLQ